MFSVIFRPTEKVQNEFEINFPGILEIFNFLLKTWKNDFIFFSPYQMRPYQLQKPNSYVGTPQKS